MTIEEKREYKKQYYQNNKVKILERSKKRNIEKKKEKSLYDKEYRKEKYKNDVLHRLKMIIKSIIKSSIKKNGYTKKSRTYDILGCSYEEFRIYIESKFETWMTWENHGLYNGELSYGWDIDHRIPLSSAKTEEELLKLFHYTNLQPLCGKINRHIKSDKMDF